MPIQSDTAKKPGKRQRTRARLLDAARQVFAEKGLPGGAIQEITSRAGVANGTFYNYFQTKEDIAAALAMETAVVLSRRIARAHAHINDGCERMAIGTRHYLLLTRQEPVLAGMIMHLASASPAFGSAVRRYVEADLRIALRQGRLAPLPLPLALDFIFSTVLMGMRNLLAQPRRSAPAYACQVAALLLSGLGLPHEAATEIARRPLPALPPLAALADPA